MTVSAKVEISGAPKEKIRIWTKSESEEIGDAIRAIIVARIASGLDLQERPFDPYDAKYAEEHGDTVTLRRTGAMINSITVKPAGRKATISMGKGLGRYPYVVNRYRTFLGLTPAEIDGPVTDKMLELLDDAIASAQGGGGIRG